MRASENSAGDREFETPEGCFFLSLLSHNFNDKFISNFTGLFMHMLRYSKLEEWSLTITNSAQCL